MMGRFGVAPSSPNLDSNSENRHGDYGLKTQNKINKLLNRELKDHIWHNSYANTLGKQKTCNVICHT